MNGRNAITTPYADSRFAARGLGLADRVLLVLFVGLFFLPYIPGARLRADVVVGYVVLLAIPLVLRFTGRFEAQFFALAAAAFLWSLARIGASLFYGENYFFAIQLLTTLNFLFFAVCFFIAIRGWLVSLREPLLMYVLTASVLINGIAVFQWMAVDHPINAFIFQNYGGTLPASVAELPSDVIGDISTNAEFLAKIAGRYSSIFGGMYVLASFNVLIIALSVAALHWQGRTRMMTRLATMAIAAAFVGGALSASKTFYLGTMIALAILSTLSVINLRRFVLLVFLVLPAYFILMSGTSDDTTVGSVFELILAGDMDAVLGSRYGAGGLFGTITAVFTSPAILFFGVGVDIGDLYLADNGYLMPIIIGGIPLALTTYVAVGLMVRENYRQFRAGNVMAAGFLAAHGSFLVAAIGIPTYQLPRVTLLLLVLNLVFLASRPHKGHSPPRSAPTRTW